MISNNQAFLVELLQRNAQTTKVTVSLEHFVHLFFLGSVMKEMGNILDQCGCNRLQRKVQKAFSILLDGMYS
ncbi:uncharacterized protein SOCG_05661 [Schizosaccharomyces octosporus yFS286]|uniref:Uncharacterized protein n=1 Tax=Schizosaccharomyces octosporus (strain yFS286) TaxID=483514 RepID=S9RF42_SCHOY|nr:uncharacterized protein SOCG_05661 [Schizosaccharomyces octosporus yFS286]EPX72694.1 hypothetical protein SOCG_05661 [Schizosaccharomyces octosporus yFS286]